MTTYYLSKDGVDFDVNADSLEEAKAKVGEYFLKQTEQTTGEFAAGAAMDLAESALGAGDELGAAALSVADFFETGDWNWSKNMEQARTTLDTFEAQNPNLSGAITAAGVAGSLLIPGGAALKLAQTGSKLSRAAKIGAVTSVEGAAYGALSGRGEEGRTQGALLGAALGGTVGIGASMLLRNSDEIARMAQEDELLREGAEEAGHIGGTNGFVDAADNTTNRNTQAPNVSGKDRSVNKVVTEEEFVERFGEEAGILETIAGKATGQAGNWLGDLNGWVTRNVGDRAARLVMDAEWMGRSARGEWIGKIEDKLSGFDDMVAENSQLSAALANLGRGKTPGSWDDVYRAVGDNEEMRTQVKVFENMYNDLKALDSKSRTTYDWIHTAKKPGTKMVDGVASEADYLGPARAMVEYADELVNANALAERFGFALQDLTIKGKQSVTEAVMSEIKKRAVKEGASKAVANNLDDALRTVFVHSKAGGDAAGSIARKVSSAAMLGNPLNAVLNMSEWVTPAFQNGLVAWGKQVPKMLTYAIAESVNGWTQFGKYGLPKIKMGGVTPDSIGLGDQFMGEVSSEGVKSYGRLVDNMTKFIYDKTFVTASNKTGQYAQMNSAVNRGRALAKTAMGGGRGAESALKKLRKHDGMRGLNESEFQKTMEALAGKDLESPWVRNYAGAALNMWQPVSATALPKGFSDEPNMRMFYSMLTYMNRQANAVKVQVGDNLVKAHKYGLNTSEGRDAMKDAMMGGARYTAYYGLGAGLWERTRTSLDPSRDVDLDEVFTAEGMTEAAMTQIVSNLSSGLVDMRADQYGAAKFDLTPAPIDYASRVGSGLLDGASGAAGMLTGDAVGEADDMTGFYRMLQGQVPGIATADKIKRMTMDGERLLVQPSD